MGIRAKGKVMYTLLYTIGLEVLIIFYLTEDAWTQKESKHAYSCSVLLEETTLEVLARDWCRGGWGPFVWLGQGPVPRGGTGQLKWAWMES